MFSKWSLFLIDLQFCLQNVKIFGKFWKKYFFLFLDSRFSNLSIDILSLFRQQIDILSEIEILSKNWNFVENRNFMKKSKFSQKTNFVKKCNFCSIKYKFFQKKSNSTFFFIFFLIDEKRQTLCFRNDLYSW